MYILNLQVAAVHVHLHIPLNLDYLVKSLICNFSADIFKKLCGIHDFQGLIYLLDVLSRFLFPFFIHPSIVLYIHNTQICLNSLEIWRHCHNLIKIWALWMKNKDSYCSQRKKDFILLYTVGIFQNRHRENTTCTGWCQAACGIGNMSAS